MSGRRIFIGDVQGCAATLEALLARCGAVRGADRLHFVGDLARRGPSSAEVLALARDWEARCVLGNHEALLLERGILEGRGTDPEAPDLAKDPRSPRFAAWIRDWPLARLIDGSILLVHAAVPPAFWKARRPADLAPLLAHPLPEPDRAWDEIQSFALTARYCDPAGRRPRTDFPPPPPPFEAWFEFYEGAFTVVFGHWARRGLVVREGLRGLDTGCVYGGRLSAWIAEEDRIVQVPRAPVDEPG